MDQLLTLDVPKNQMDFDNVATDHLKHSVEDRVESYD
jgi:hypothetical protein